MAVDIVKNPVRDRIDKVWELRDELTNLQASYELLIELNNDLQGRVAQLESVVSEQSKQLADLQGGNIL